MGKLFSPDHMLETIDRFDASGAAERGVALVFSDLDNTLTRWSDATVPPSALAFAARLRARGIDLCIVSNNNDARVKPFAQAVGAEYIAKAAKPLPFTMQKKMRRKGLSPSRCALIGDQLLTDVLSGNLAGMATYLVKPIDRSHEFRGTKINRKLEGVLFRILGLSWRDK